MCFLDMYNIWHSISQLSSEARTKWLPRPLDRFKAKAAMTSTLGEQHNTWLMGLWHQAWFEAKQCVHSTNRASLRLPQACPCWIH